VVRLCFFKYILCVASAFRCNIVVYHYCDIKRSVTKRPVPYVVEKIEQSRVDQCWTMCNTVLCYCRIMCKCCVLLRKW